MVVRRLTVLAHLLACSLCVTFDQDALHIGVVMPFSGDSNPDIYAATISACVQADLEIGKVSSPPVRNFVMGCVATDCELSTNSSNGLIGPSLPVPDQHPLLQRVKFHLADSRHSTQPSARAMLEFAYGVSGENIPPMNAVLGATEDDATATMANIGGVLDVVQVANLATGEVLTEKADFPYLFRVADANSAIGVAFWDYVRYFGFRGTAMIREDRVEGSGSELGIDIQTGLQASADADGRSDDFESYGILGAQTGSDVGGESQQKDAELAAERVRASDHRLVLFAFRDDFGLGKLARRAMAAAGVVAPRYQVLTTLYTVSVATDSSWMEGHTFWHGMYIHLNFADPSLGLTLLTFNHMTPEDVVQRLPSYGVDRWDSSPDLSRLTPEFFQGIPPYFPLVLDIHAAFNVILRAFNEMLNDGFQPAQIHGSVLKEYVKGISFDGYGKQYAFDEQQDSTSTMSLVYLDEFDDSNGVVPITWRSVALRERISKTRGQLHLLTDDGPRWATGAFGRLPPEELTACTPGQRLLRLTPADFGTCEACAGGRFSTNSSATSCTPCAAGRYSAAGSLNCTECSPGRFAPEGSDKCLPCFAGSFATLGGLSACVGCPVGKFQNATGQLDCIDCFLGRAGPSPRLENCQLCSPGTSAASEGQITCDPCPAGTYQDGQGAMSCQVCAPGSFTLEPGSRECILCDPGRYQPNASASKACELCDAGTYAEGHGSSGCARCEFGSTQLLGAASRTLCTCDKDTFFFVDALNASSRQCIGCNEYMEPCLGGVLAPRQRAGYYVSQDGSQIYQCASQDACPGGLLGECPEGSRGPGCAECDKNSHYWDGDKCSECTSANVFLIVLFPCVMVAVLTLTYWFGNDPIGRKVSAISEFIVLVGLSVSIIFFLSSFTALDVSWKEPVKTFMSLSKVFSTELTNVHVSCSVETGPAFSMAVTSSIPLIVGVCCASLAHFRVCRGKRLFNTFGTLLYALFLLLVLHGLKPFRYIVHPVGKKSLLFLPSVFEGSSDHVALMIVGIAVILVYCVPFGAACVYAAWCVGRSSSAVKRRWFLTSFRFLFYKFKSEASYWGVCILVRNTAFGLIPSLVPEQPSVGIFLLTIVSVLSVAHTAFVRPWRAEWMSYTDVGILLYMTLILTLGVGWVRKDPDSDSVLATLMALIAGIAIALGVATTLKLTLRIACAGREGRQRMREKIEAEMKAVERDMLGQYADPKQEVAEAFDLLQQEMGGQSPQHQNGKLQLPAALLWVSEQPCRLAKVARIAQQIRDPDYSCQCFFEDCLSTFPELHLYIAAEGTPNVDDLAAAAVPSASENTATISNGVQELRRTLGALFAVYWICRADLDGRRGFSCGVQEDNPHKCKNLPAGVKPEDLQGVGWGKMTPEQRRLHFYANFNWQLIFNLFQQAGIFTSQSDDGRLELDVRPGGRLVAMLCLTAFHDIMKNQGLCPKVQGEAYGGLQPGETILDHDLALAYILDRFPEMLPSFCILSEEQRQVVRFTQSEMGFNAGWLVQGEGPPGAVLSKLKKAITAGRAADEDVAFYFVHWVTDLAGAEPTPFNGCEKFSVKFPPAVLQGLLGCFSVVKELASKTETEVYEQYLVQRWKEAGTFGPIPEGRTRTAKLRIHCMAQGGAKQVLHEFENLCEEDRVLLSKEMAETGIEDQYFSEWTDFEGPQVGIPVLMYYGPAWLQRVGMEQPLLSLQVLAASLRRCRKAFADESKDMLVSRQGSKTAHMGVLKTIDLLSLEAVWETTGESILDVEVENAQEGTLKVNILSF